MIRRVEDIPGVWGRRRVRAASDLVFFLLLFSLLLPSYPAWAIDLQSIVKQNEGAVVVIVGRNTTTGASVQSSGCFVDASGLILTTAHQVTGVDQLRARLVDGRESALSVVATDAVRELALLKAELRPVGVAVLGDARRLTSGAPLVSISAPVSLDFTTVNGIVSNTNRTYKGYPVIQTNLPASPGSSGGPVFDQNGALVAVIIGKIEGEDWITVVNPVNNAFELLRSHGVAISETPGAPQSEPEDLIIPAKDITALELEAVRTYNRGVTASTPIEKAAEYRAAVGLLPSFYEAWFNLAVALTAINDVGAAADAYRHAAALRPKDVAVFRNLGRVLLKQQQFKEAVATFERAVALVPDQATAQNDLGEAHRQAGQLDKAERAFLKALALDGQYALARYNLGLTYAAQGRNSEAVVCLREYLRLTPNAADAAEVQALIERLSSGMS